MINYSKECRGNFRESASHEPVFLIMIGFIKEEAHLDVWQLLFLGQQVEGHQHQAPVDKF